MVEPLIRQFVILVRFIQFRLSKALKVEGSDTTEDE